MVGFFPATMRPSHHNHHYSQSFGVPLPHLHRNCMAGQPTKVLLCHCLLGSSAHNYNCLQLNRLYATVMSLPATSYRLRFCTIKVISTEKNSAVKSDNPTDFVVKRPRLGVLKTPMHNRLWQLPEQKISQGLTNILSQSCANTCSAQESLES